MPEIFIVRRRVPSQNLAAKSHWREYQKEKLIWRRMMREVMPQRIPRRAFVAIALRSYRERLVDFANLVGGAKPIPDTLITLGYIWDDSPSLFSCDYSQIQVPKSAVRTELEFLPTTKDTP